jgi:excisionase family DNA binding protein
MRSEAWVSIDAIARHLDVSKDTVYRWLDHREMPGHKVGRAWKFKISEVDAWVRTGNPGVREEGGRKV